ncbi:DUF6345 domain-containing protein [Nocardia sp. NPDC005746]|uniref:DUF6345 domain-containing protein n=1 Tax=Nocardia sp. NPDC005746 TaxID=3157062 RepID=UPI0033C8D4F8
MSDNMYGGASVQVYPKDATLTYPHACVSGFLDYVAKFNGVNFHAKDDDVREWRYDQEYDNWQDSLGMDSVRVFYHYAHSTTMSNGVYLTSMGRTWDNTIYAESDRMGFGDQRLRYLFLHGCESLRTNFGHSPYRTWHTPNRGARMLFGFDSLTFDTDQQGTRFFKEWNTGKSFSQAWQDAALSIFHNNHRVSSAACGATDREAQDRLWNERLFHGGAVSDDWYWWRWAGQFPLEVDLSIPLPRQPMSLRLARRSAEADTAAALGERHGLRGLLAESASPVTEESCARAEFEPRLVMHPDGAYQAFYAEPDRTANGRTPEEIRDLADLALRELDLGHDLALAGMSATFHAGASRDGDTVAAAVADYTLHYRQLHNGVPAVAGGDGQLTMTLDPTGQLCSISDTTVPILSAEQAHPPTTDDTDACTALTEATAARAECLGGRARLAVVPDSREIGYRYDRDDAALVARQTIEITGGRFRIRDIVEVTV